MTDAVATTTGLAEWRPDLGPLPPGWQIVAVQLHADVDSWRHHRREAEITLRYEPFHPGIYHEVRLRVIPQTPPVSEWLRPFLDALSKVGPPTFAEIDCAGRR